MNPVERVMRVMTHLNIGASLGIAAWMVWASVQVASGAWPIRPLVPPLNSVATSADRHHSSHHASHHAGRTERPCCLVPLRASNVPETATAARPSSLSLVAQATAAEQLQ